MARPAREQQPLGINAPHLGGWRLILSKMPVIHQTTRYSGEIAQPPFIQRVLRPAAQAYPIVGGPQAFCGPASLPQRSLKGVLPTTAATKPERSANGGSVKARQRALPRYEKRKEGNRLMRFREAVAFAYAMDWPLNIGLTITWAALETAGERNEGHCLGRGEWGREKYARDELARLCRSERLPFVALWGRDVGADMGSHVHLSMF
jgi:hypothetical protein